MANIVGHGAPTEKTPGVVGQKYVDVDSDKVWVCVDVKHVMRVEDVGMNSTYEWDFVPTYDDEDDIPDSSGGSESGSGSDPVISEVSLLSASWVEESSTMYSQVVTIDGVTANSKVDLQPTPAQLSELYSSGLMLTTANDNGVVTIYSIGGHPTSDLVVQVLISEVSV